MSALHANCPSCGGQVAFRIGSSFVTICEFCSTAVARTDRGLEDHGKVVDLIDSASPLDLYLEGRYGNSRFELVGRTQIQHGAGGVWDEWYCAFDSGHWGWLSEAQGRFYMSFASPVENPPPYQQLGPGAQLPIGGGMVVSEIGEAQILGAKGEIPYLIEPGKTYSYADLSGQNGVFGTLDYGDVPPTFYLGKEVTLAELGIAISAPARDESAERAPAGAPLSAQALECPNCRGSLDLVAPDQCERVGCPYCGALSDVSDGKLSVLQILDKERFPDPPLALGSKGEFEGHEMIIAGYMVRSVYYEGEAYYWDEYLLYNARIGFRWLVDSDGHWSYVEPLGAADVQAETYYAKHDGRSYRAFDDVGSQVEFVLGQFYWNVEPGERVQMREFMSPPYTLSEERTATEINWSKGTYMPKEDIETRFGVELREPTAGTVGLGQPYPYGSVYKLFAVLLLLAIGAFAYGKTRATGKEVLRQTFDFVAADAKLPGVAAVVPESQVAFSEPFTLKGGRNIEVEAYSSVNNSWVYLQFDLINQSTGAATFFDLPIERYSGSGWSEGSAKSKKVLKAVGSGEYTLRVGIERSRVKNPAQVRVVLREGVMRFRYFLVLLGFLALIPFFTMLHQRGFERRRWSDASMAGPVWSQEFDYD